MRITDFSRLVLIADNVSFDKKTITPFTREVDRAYTSNVKHLKAGFEQLFSTVIIYDDPHLFLENVAMHKKDIIFPYWHGKDSRNKHAVVASICEIENLIYIGPDTYTNIVCSDKILSKDICRLASVKYPKFKVISDSPNEFNWPYKFPAVVKPVYEGSSLGMTQDNIVTTNSEIIRIANQLLKEFHQPVLIEEFIGGVEINLAFVGWKNNIKVWSAAERYHKTDPHFFDKNLFAFKEKNLDNEITIRDGRYLISESMLAPIIDLFAWLDKIEHIRIDGKIWQNEFYCIELTQDADLDPDGSFFSQLKYAGYSFNDALKLLVENCLERYNSLYPNLS